MIHKGHAVSKVKDVRDSQIISESNKFLGRKGVSHDQEPLSVYVLSNRDSVSTEHALHKKTSKRHRGSKKQENQRKAFLERLNSPLTEKGKGPMHIYRSPGMKLACQKGRDREKEQGGQVKVEILAEQRMAREVAQALARQTLVPADFVSSADDVKWPRIFIMTEGLESRMTATGTATLGRLDPFDL